MAESNFVAGYAGSVSVTGDGTLDITEWTLERTINVLDGTHSGSNASFIPVFGAPMKAVANVKGNHDSAKNVPLDLTEGDWVTATLKYGTDDATIEVEGIASKINDTNTVTGFTSYEFTIEGFVTADLPD